jgi:acetyl esterase/lipase
VEKDIVFGKTGDVELKLDLYRQQAHVDDPSSVQPGLVVIFGGGFKAGNKEMMRLFAEQYARAGFVVTAANYRLLPKYPFPAAVEDVKCAVRWMRANASRFRIDPDKLGAVGMSAGGYLAMMLGYLEDSDGFQGDGGHASYSSKVQAVVNYAGAFDLTIQDWAPKHDADLAAFNGGPLTAIPDRYRVASPRTYVNRGDAPTLILHGTKDPVVPYGQAILAHSALTDAGVPHRLHLMPGAQHGWWGKELQETQRLTIEFFTEQLRNGKRVTMDDSN